MLPLDLLSQPGVYLPRTPEVAKIVPHDILVSDVLHQEMQRRFVHAEVSAGRLPLWLPYQYSGSPNISPWLSPLVAIAWSTASPVIWAWVHLLEALVAGIGAYVFFRRVLAVGFWPAALAAWCYPMTGFFVFWQGNMTSGAVFWLPWLLFAVERVARSPSGFSITGLTVATALTLVGGNLDVAGQCLFAAGLFALWRIIEIRLERTTPRRMRNVILSLGTGWVLGFMVASPYWLPVVDYSQGGSRFIRRAAGVEERPPAGITALPATVIPDQNGSTRAESVWLGKWGNQIESSAAMYAGLIATLFAAPLAWCSRRHRTFVVGATAMILLSLAWSLNLPLLVSFLRLPLLNMMSHNRLVFVGSFFILCLAAIGLEVLWKGANQRHVWYWGPAFIVLGLAAWSIHRMTTLPEPIGTELVTAIRAGQTFGWVRTVDDVARLQGWFIRMYGVVALFSIIALLGWIWLLLGKRFTPSFVTLLGTFMIGDMLWFAHGRTTQSDPALYFPRLEFFETLAKTQPERILGFSCLPAPLAQSVGLRDVRGYDGVDPERYISLMELAAAPGVSRPPYALTQWFQPRANIELPGRLQLPPVLDLLGVRYLIFRGDPPANITPQLRSFDYWALENPSALPRAFVPQTVEFEPNNVLRLRKLGASEFNPRLVAYSEEALDLPSVSDGSAMIIAEQPTRVFVSVKMVTRGLVVLADRWESGWAAYIEDRPVRVHRINHALRGVVVPPGLSTVEFRYEPPSFAWGLRMAFFAGVVTAVLLIWTRVRAPRPTRPEEISVPIP